MKNGKKIVKLWGVVFGLICTGVMPVGMLRADVIYWDGVTGGWDSTANWTTDPTATTPDPLAVPGISDDVWFNRDGINTASTISLNGNQSANLLTFRSTGTITLQGGGVDRTLTLGAGGVNKTGTGAVTIGSATAGQNVAIVLGASQTWTNGNATGAFTINNGVTGAASTNQTLTIDGTGSVSIGGAILDGSGGTLSLIKNGTNGLSIRSGGTYTGSFTLNSGSINNGGGSPSGTTGATGQGQLIINGGSISNNATGGNSNFNLNNTSQIWGGDFSLSTGAGATLQLTLGQNVSNAITLTGHRVVSTGGSSTNSRININGTIGDGGNGYNLTWAGTGTGNVRVNLGAAANTYTGTTTVLSSLIQFSGNVVSGQDSAFGNSTSAILLGGTSGSTTAGILANAGTYSFDRDIILQSGGTGTLIIGSVAASETGGALMNNSGTITLGTGTTGRNVTLHRGNFSGNIVDPAGLLSSPGVVTIAASRAINGNGENGHTTTLSGNNTFSGGVVLRNDVTGDSAANSTITLALNSATALGTGTLTILPSAASRFVALNSTAASPMVLTTNNAQVWNGDFSFTGTQSLDMGTGAVSLGTVAGATRTVTTTANVFSIGGVISNGTDGVTPTVNLTKAGAGTLALYGSNTYTGLTTISAGTLQLGNGGTTGSVAGDIVNNATLVVNRSNAYNLSNAISGTGAFTHAGSGTTTLSGTSSYSGATNVNAGTLLINGSLSNSSVTVSASGAVGGSGTIGGSLFFAAGADFVFSLTDTLTVNGASVSFGGFGIEDLFGLNSSVAAGTYTLIDGTASFDFTNVSNFGVENAYDLGGGKLAYFQAGSLELVVVPEPSTYALLGFGLGVLFLLRRKELKLKSRSL